ncbi:S100-Z [Solea senegalensis]|uniref:Protein S100 n=2 Tax=Solea senegalensis TaxID=28829 RepID=A0AAV6R1I1_SOLSE|nr:S100-Z [Solea senegalensis]
MGAIETMGLMITHGAPGGVILDSNQEAAEAFVPSSEKQGKMPSQLEGAMDALISVFYNYSGNEGDAMKLNKGELKELLNSELNDFLTCQKDPRMVEKIMNDLDSNKDNEVDFNEFVVLVAALTVACNDFLQEKKKKSKN